MSLTDKARKGMRTVNWKHHRFNLEYYKNVKVTLNPLLYHKSTSRAREFMTLMDRPALKSSNPKCELIRNMTYQTTPAYVTLTFLNGVKRSYWFDKKLPEVLPQLYFDSLYVISEHGLKSEMPEDPDWEGVEGIELWDE